MKHIFYFAFLVAFKSLGTAALSRALDLSNNDPHVRGGASHECYRECVHGDVRTCYYEFTLSEWLAMSIQCKDCPYTKKDCYARGCLTAGGDVRTVTVVNQMLPGPGIHVCYGDIIQVNVTNELGGEGVTIHWHGMGQVETPYMDGVPFLTQCPILPGNSFLYEFAADPAGTHMWHSHVGLQEADGFHGSLIIRQADDINADYYDFDLPDHTMMIWHWYGAPTSFEAKASMLKGRAPMAYSFTVNGLAATRKYVKNNETYYTPRAKFTVSEGYRYRFRSISNTAIYCPIQVSVDSHTLTMIATDGASFEPVKVDSFITNAGQRYDFVLTADQKVGNYWIRYRGMGISCSEIRGEAILHYEGASDDDPSKTINYDNHNRPGVLLNPVGEANTDYSNNTLIRTATLKNTMQGRDVDDVSGNPDHVLYIPIAMNSYPNFQTPGPYAQIQNISFKLPPVPILTQPEDISEDMLCTQYDSSAKSCSHGYCTCPIVYEIEKDSLIEMILIDTTVRFVDDHPLHIHGNYVREVAKQAGTTSIMTVDKVRALNKAGSIRKNLKTAPLRDVVDVPGHGFVVLRMVANNPGYWLFHCHVAFHFEEGMGFVLKVGDREEMRKTPQGFPKCSGNYDITAET